MPYRPGIQDRSGEILGAGIANGIGGFSNVLNGLAGRYDQDRQQKEELMALLGGSGTESDPGMADLSMFGVPEGASEGTGEGNATQEDKVAAAAKVTKAMRTLAEHGYGMDKNMLETMSTAELRGVLRKQEMGAVRQERAQRAQLTAAQMMHLAGMTAAENERLQVSKRGREAEDKFNALVNDGGQELTPETLLQFGAKAGLPVRNQLEMAKTLRELAKADPEAADNAPSVVNLGGRQWAYSPKTGAFQIIPDSSGEGVPITDSETGEVVPGLVNVGGKVVRMPAQKNISGELMPVKDPVSGEPVPGFGMDATGKVHDLRSEVEKKLGDMGKPRAAASSSGPAAPKSQKEFDALPVGALFVNPKDGKTYRKK
jgi:hypothetical protein